MTFRHGRMDWAFVPSDIAASTADEVLDIAESVANGSIGSQRLTNYMYAGFLFTLFAEDHPDMTAEEIASAAADGFAVEV